MRSIAGAATGCEKSDVDHRTPIVRKRESSPAPGQVLDVVSRGPACRPLVRFFCIRDSLAIHCVAQVIGKDCAREKMLERSGSAWAKEGVSQDAV